VESIVKLVEERKNPNLVAVGINCINPDFVLDLFKSLRIKVPLVVYPNSGGFTAVIV
jgi:S-methylmethionine-dependent homocysteine/selenocysteine methylase